ncbi:MAG: ATP-dependent helicase [Patescibacteria group bacterium]
MKIDYENLLNEEQLEVVKNGDGYSLVLSGPGSGKTRTLTFRVAYLLEKGIDPENILLLTFTKKAAKEMLHRIESLVGSQAHEVLGGTFHHVGNYYLRRYANELGYERNFTILDQEDSKNLIQTVVDKIDEEGDLPSAKSIQMIISLATNSDDSVLEIADGQFNSDSAREKIVEVEKQYQAKKKKKNLMDYDDLLLNWLKLLKKPELKKRIAKRFEYVLVDEYQDTNVIQDELLEKLSSYHKNLMVVGDDSQSIYSFRAAEIKNILNFSEKYPANVFKLETNYRSTPQILKLANCIIENNTSKLDKQLKSVKEEGSNPVVACLTSPREQSKFIVQKINKELNPAESAILFRAHYHAAGLELELAKEGIPYIVRGGTRFFEQAHVKDISSFLKLLVNFKDEPSWIRVLKKQEGVGDAYAQRATDVITSFETEEEIVTNKSSVLEKVPSRVAPKVEEILNLMESIRDAEKTEDGLEDLLENWYKEKLESDYDNARERMDDVKQLIDLSKDYDNLREMLSDFALSEEFEINKNSENALTLSTIHQAKGLEWKNVFIISLKEGKFPHKKSVEENLIEEERRLFYVAVTRCKENLFLTYPVFEKRGSSNPSRFLREVEEHLMEDWENEMDKSGGNDKLELNESDDEEEIELIDEDDFDFF